MNNRNKLAGARNPGNVRAGFYIHLATFLVVNAFLAAINLITSSATLWFVWPLAGWGIGLFAHALVAFGLPYLRASSNAVGK